MEIPDGETFGQALRRVRGDRSLRRVAALTSYSKSYLGDLESGRRRPNAQLARTLDHALGAGGQLLASLGPDFFAPSSEGTLTLGATLRLWDDLLLRRDFLVTATAATTAAGLVRPTISLPSGDGEARLAAHHEVHTAYGRLGNLLGAPAVVDQAAAHHRSVMAWYHSIPPGPDRRRIGALAAITAGLTGFHNFDLGNYGAAAHAYREAVQLGVEAQDVSSVANHLGQMSRAVSMTGQYSHALTFATTALHTAGTRAHPAVRSWLHAVRSYHHATLGNPRSAYADLDAAWALLPHADDGTKPMYVGYLDAAELSKWTAHTRTRLGEDAPALAAVTEAHAQWPSHMVRGSAEIHVATARVHLAAGDLDQGIASLTTAATIAHTTGSARNFAAVTKVRATLGNQRLTPAVRDFDDYLLTGQPHPPANPAGPARAPRRRV